MLKWNSVVFKLWITIIGLVAIVLLILSLFISQFIDAYFNNSREQHQQMVKQAQKVAAEVRIRLNQPQELKLISDMLASQESGMIILDQEMKVRSFPAAVSGGMDGDSMKNKLNDFFSMGQLKQVRSGHIEYSADSVSVKKNEFTAVAVPIYADGGQGSVTGELVYYRSMKMVEDTQFAVKKLFVISSGIGFLLITFFAFFLTTRITRPLRQLKKAADLITQGEYRTRVPVPSRDEIGELAKTFNHMAERLDDTIKALNMEKEHLASVLRSMTDAVITFDAAGIVILTNPQGERILQEWSRIGWQERNSDTDEAYEDFDRMGDSEHVPEPLQELFQFVLKGTKQLSSNLHVNRGVWSVVMAPLYSKDSIRGAVAVLRDVTEEHRLDKLRKDFVANISHELRTPLSMMQGYSEALLDDIAASPEERKELTQVIHDESLRMGRLVKDLLDLAKMEAGHVEYHFKKVNLTVLLARVYRKFSVRCKEHEIQLVWTADEEERILQHADEDRLEQVFTNLLDNAIRHSPAQSTIRIGAKGTKYKGRPAYRLEIADEGEGIPASDVPYIFERFYKADKARTRGSNGGTGLGLSIVKNLVDAHQGTIEVKSVLGSGTTFYVTLPCKA